MPKRLGTVLVVASLLAAPGAFAQPAPSVRPQFAQGSMNVYRRFAAEDRGKMVDFYDKVLGLKPLQPINLGGGQQMILFGVGNGQIKLATGLKEAVRSTSAA